ncbi:MAG: DNA polymerase III subunit gamma/tau [Sphingobacteriales bacterium]
MDKFIVSARKYRPQNFSTVVGQSHITTTLKNAIRNKQLAHAFLFCGPRGVGKTTCARILAKTINCMNLDAEGEACNECTSCISFNNGSSLNIHELDAASNNSVDDIRNLVDQVRFAPQAGEYKVYIIDEVHMLSSSAFNAFLKTLEEPPAYAKFILATTEKHKILPTILSRCQIFDFKRITTQDTVDHLQEICNKEGIKAEKSALHVIAQKSEGCMRDSLSIMDKIASFTNNQLTYTNTLEHLNILDEDYFFRLLENMQQQKLAEALLVFEDINRKGFEGEMVLNGFAEFIRNILVCRDTKTASLLEAVEGFREKYQEAAKTISLSWLVSALQILNEAEINYKQARNRRLHVELCFIKLTYLHQAIEVAQDGAKKKMDSVKPVAFRKIGFVEEKSGAVSAPTASTTTAAPKLTIKETKEEKQTAPNSVSPNQTKPVSLPPQPKFGNLQKIRDQISRKPQVEQNQIPLTQEKLQQAWELYVDKLLKANNPSAATNFRLAVLKILDDQNFDIITEGNIQQKFIESERGGLIEHLQTFFNNKNLKYHLILEENEETKDKTPKDRPIPPREQYQKMVEIYPLIKDLRDRLGMDLDY